MTASSISENSAAGASSADRASSADSASDTTGTTGTGAIADTAWHTSPGWHALSLLQGRIDSHLERALQSAHDLSSREYSLLEALSQQHDGDGGHLRMNQVADAVVLSQSATTRLVTRLEDRGLLERYLCPTDRRGIYTNVTPAGLDLLNQARPTHDRALREALDAAAADPRLTSLVDAVERLNDGVPDDGTVG